MSPIWVFGYGSLIWNPGFAYDDRVVGFVRDYRRVFYQGSTDHRGTPQFPGRTVTLEHQPGATCVGPFSCPPSYSVNVTAKDRLITRTRKPNELVNSWLMICHSHYVMLSCSTPVLLIVLDILWGVAYRIKEEDEEIALEYLEVREKQYDEKVYLDLYTDSSPKVPAVENVMVYFATSNKKNNQNYLGPAPLEEMTRQIYLAQGPSGPNKEYVFKLEDALHKLGVVDQHVQELANALREYSDTELSK
ncbi:Gamma-glutamylcyclotransferase 2-1 [Zea mays]|uniref:glutathione-specific gamma-glutamylcyclotransferase n=1 Tax=Zea mays TaxID=4577 RepID=A0A3L6GE85_MAIZE|nr:Gamma-glutamylcyclotransferase 2-1 [Zea mays]